VGALALYHERRPLPQGFFGREGVAGATLADWEAITAATARAIHGVTPHEGKARIYSVSLNREATPTIARSTLAIKADAARRLFNISCGDLAWAIVDSGIDARHPAFRQRQDKELRPDAFRNDNDAGGLENCTRVLETYDFSQIDLLLDPETSDLPDNLKRRLKGKGGKELRDQLKILNE